MSVQIGNDAKSLFLEGNDLVCLRMEECWQQSVFFDDFVPVNDKAPRFRHELDPRSIVEEGGKLWEILAAFRLEGEPNIWRFLAEEVAELDTPREVPISVEANFGFCWEAVLPRIVWEYLFVSEYVASTFFACLQGQGSVKIFTVQQLLAGRVLVHTPYEEPHVYMNEDRLSREEVLVKPYESVLLE